jgi:hypothetical protein
MNGYSSENPDPFCKKLLAEKNPRELSEWLRDKSHTLGELPNDESSSLLAEELYAAGAAHVYGVEIHIYPGGENTGKLVIELPLDASARKKVLDWAAKIAHQQGFDAYSDVGQQYVFVMLD